MISRLTSMVRRSSAAPAFGRIRTAARNREVNASKSIRASGIRLCKSVCSEAGGKWPSSAQCPLMRIDILFALISGPPTRCQAVYRCFWFRNWGLSQATSGNPRSSASRHKAACRLRRQAIYTRSTWRSSRR